MTKQLKKEMLESVGEYNYRFSDEAATEIAQYVVSRYLRDQQASYYGIISELANEAGIKNYSSDSLAIYDNRIIDYVESKTSVVVLELQYYEIAPEVSDDDQLVDLDGNVYTEFYYTEEATYIVIKGPTDRSAKKYQNLFGVVGDEDLFSYLADVTRGREIKKEYAVLLARMIKNAREESVGDVYDAYRLVLDEVIRAADYEEIDRDEESLFTPNILDALEDFGVAKVDRHGESGYESDWDDGSLSKSHTYWAKAPHVSWA